MYKLIAVTLAALYGVLLIFGDEARRPAEVTRAESLDLTLISASVLSPETTGQSPYMSAQSDREAIDLAMAAGRALRAAQSVTTNAPGDVSAGNGVEPASVAAPAPVTPEIEYWYVTGTRVNLRGGPGTGNAVVGQVTLGAQAEVLESRDGWYQIRLAEGSASGWIFGEFLDARRPG